MFGGLNNDWVLWLSLGSVALSAVSLIVWGLKTFLAMEGLDSSESESK